MKFKVLNNEAGERVDLFLVKKFSNYSRSILQQAVESGAVKVNSSVVKSSYKLKTGNIVSIDKDFFQEVEKPLKIISEKLPLEILYEDENIIAVNKPAGMVVHPATGNKTGTLVNAILNYDQNIINAIHDETSKISLSRPGIIHRLDKDTSGVILIAKNKKTLSSLSKQLQNKTIKKKYSALVLGWPQETGSVKSYLTRGKKNRKIVVEMDSSTGKKAISNYMTEKLLITADGKNHIALVEIEIPTGRTHQIRVQLKGIGHPIIGDQTYNIKESKTVSDILGAKRQMLHAKTIEFILPGQNKPIIVTSEIPEDFKKVKSKLKDT